MYHVGLAIDILMDAILRGTPSNTAVGRRSTFVKKIDFSVKNVLFEFIICCKQLLNTLSQHKYHLTIEKLFDSPKIGKFSEYKIAVTFPFNSSLVFRSHDKMSATRKRGWLVINYEPSVV